LSGYSKMSWRCEEQSHRVSEVRTLVNIFAVSSGDIYATVPRVAPGLVKCSSLIAVSWAVAHAASNTLLPTGLTFASPKSRILACPGGLTVSVPLLRMWVHCPRATCDGTHSLIDSSFLSDNHSNSFQVAIRVARHPPAIGLARLRHGERDWAERVGGFVRCQTERPPGKKVLLWHCARPRPVYAIWVRLSEVLDKHDVST
jgi:hypothetical protein